MRLPDLLSVNLYPCWYFGKPSALSDLIDKCNSVYGSKGLAVSEYGAGGSIHQHQQNMTEHPKPGGPWNPEEWQAICHEGNYAAIKSRTEVWGSFLWVMFDFASAGRHEGDMEGINDKGLFTRDRTVKKDAFYLYKAHWTSDPMVYITSRRDTERTVPETTVKVYSNASKVVVKINGKPEDLTPVTDHVFVGHAVLSKGDNTIEAQGTEAGRTVQDSCHWRYSTKN